MESPEPNIEIPVAYDSGTTILGEAEFVFSPSSAFAQGPTKVRGRVFKGSTQLGQIGPSNATVSSGRITVSNMNIYTLATNTAQFFNPLRIEWEVSLDNGANWYDAGETGNRVYVSFGGVETSLVVYETLADIACRANDGNATVRNVVLGVWSVFSDAPGVPRVDGTTMTYWNTSSPAEEYNTMLSSDSADGNCAAWAYLLAHSIWFHGFGTAVVYKITPIEGEGFLVSNWSFGEHIRTKDSQPESTPRPDDFPAPFPVNGARENYPIVGPGANSVLDSTPVGDDYTDRGISGNPEWPFLLHRTEWAGQSLGARFGDVSDQIGIKGQGNTDPVSIFSNHNVVGYGNAVFDPSYGVKKEEGTLSSIKNAYENDAISGYWTVGMSPFFGNRYLVRENDNEQQELNWTIGQQ